MEKTGPPVPLIIHETTKDNVINDVVDISKDTIIAVKHSRGLLLTTNGAKTWRDIFPDQLTKESTIDDHGVVWAFDSWKGIHEASYSRLSGSTNLGKTWNKAEFDINKFFPLHIYSKPHEPLCIITRDYKIYRLTGKNLYTDWKFTDSIPRQEEFLNPYYVIPYDIDNYDTLKLLRKVNHVTDTLLTLNNAGDVSNMIKVKDTLFLAGNTKDHKAYFASVTLNKKYKEYKVAGKFACVKQGRQGHIWVYGDAGLYLKVKNNLIKIL